MKRTLFILTISLLYACTHTLELTSEPTSLSDTEHPNKAVKLGFQSSNDDLVNAAINEISKHRMVSDIKRYYRPGNAEIDYEIVLTTHASYDAAGKNLFITFPGFLVFTHAWYGYEYTVDIETTSVLLDRDGNVINETVISTPYEFRYTSFARGASASLVGWITPGYGILAIIPGGMFAANYDKRADTDLFKALAPSYSSFIAEKVIEQISNVSNLESVGSKSSISRQPTVVNVSDEFITIEKPDDEADMAHVVRSEKSRKVRIVPISGILLMKTQI
jgi:hypothetical protein